MLAEVHQRAADMHQLLASSGIALLITAVLSIALGWLAAGRVLRPLRTMTAATQRISEQNLHERLAVAGPDDELKRLGDTIDGLLARLEAAFDAQRRFVANASHELRTPLTMMRTALDVATRKPGPPAPGVTILAGKIRAGLDKADRLVESFLTLARAQHGGTVRRSTVALDKLATTVLADHCAAINDMHLTVGQDHHDAPVPGNQALLTHLIGNLIDNAIRHNQPGGWICVATGTGTDTARLVVENSGPVLDPGRVGELAQPFRRAVPDRTGTDDTGVGLGLSIVAAIAATHHGTAGPARPPGRRAARHRHPPARRPPGAHRGSGIMRILVVEDVHGLADDIAEGLRDEGFAVDVAYDGLDAAAKLDTNAYQVVVLDRDLPGIHGDTLCRMITESDRPAMTLMLTAAGTSDDRISGLSLGADDYLTKPFHFTELVLRIRALARRQPTARPRIYHAAGLTLDPQRHTATRNGRPLDLSVKEFGVLEALLRAAPAFLSTEELLEQVWDENADPFTNTVFNTLSRLRRKLGNPSLIETRPGVGYRITDPAETPR